MKSSFKLLCALTLLGSAYADLDVDIQDIPAACQGICRPILELSRTCDIDPAFVGGPVAEFQGERACYCDNDSFDVGRITGLCQSCVSQNAFSFANTRGMWAGLLVSCVISGGVCC